MEFSEEVVVDEERPEHINPLAWQYKSVIEKSMDNLDGIIGDIVASGEVEVDELLHFIDWLKDPNRSGLEGMKMKEEESGTNLLLCGKVVKAKISRTDLQDAFPDKHSVAYVIISTILGFSTCYLPISLKDVFLNREKWWVAFICSSTLTTIADSTSSLFLASVKKDYWCGLARPLALSLLCTLWRLSIDIRNYTSVTTLPFFDWQLDWRYILPYVDDFCRYGILLLPLWVWVGVVGHPLAVLMMIVESINRYAFGQAGTAGWLHAIVQLIRGAASVAAVWALLQYKQNGLTLAGAITLATFMGSFPVLWTRSNLKKWPIYFGWPFLCSIVAFAMAYGIVDQLDNRWDIISWVAFGCFTFVNILIPQINSEQFYLFMTLRILPGVSWLAPIRVIVNIVLAPVFIASVFHGSSLNLWFISFAIVHSVQKALTEPHMFTLSVAMTVITFPREFGYLERDMAFCVSLLIITKLESIFPVVRYLLSLGMVIQDMGDGDDVWCFQSLLAFGANFVRVFPCPQWCWEFPSLVWSFFSGSSLRANHMGRPVLLPSSPRPYYFWEWPAKPINVRKEVVENMKDHFSESVISSILCLPLCEQLSGIVNSGKMGFVTCGNYYCFVADAWTVFVQVVAIEPTHIKIQIRDLKFNQDRHSEEVDILRKPHPMVVAAMGVMAPRCSPILMYGYAVQSADFAEVFGNCSAELKRRAMLAGFCHCIAKENPSLAGLTAPTNAQRDATAQDEMVRYFRVLDKEYTQEEIERLMDVWGVLRKQLVWDNGTLRNESLLAVISGSLVLDEANSWLLTRGELVSEILCPAGRLAVGMLLDTWAQVAPNFSGDFTDEVAREHMDFVRRFESICIVAGVESKEFAKALRQQRTILTAARTSVEGGEDSLRVYRFALQVEELSIWEANYATVHAAWAGQLRGAGLMVGNELASRHDWGHFYQTFIQASNKPVGAPGYISGFADAVGNPFWGR